MIYKQKNIAYYTKSILRKMEFNVSTHIYCILFNCCNSCDPDSSTFSLKLIKKLFSDLQSFQGRMEKLNAYESMSPFLQSPPPPPDILLTHPRVPIMNDSWLQLKGNCLFKWSLWSLVYFILEQQMAISGRTTDHYRHAH